MRWELKKFLYDKGIYQKDLAKAVGVSEVMISDIVTGKKKPSKRLSKLIAEKLEISENKLAELVS